MRGGSGFRSDRGPSVVPDTITGNEHRCGLQLRLGQPLGALDSLAKPVLLSNNEIGNPESLQKRLCHDPVRYRPVLRVADITAVGAHQENWHAAADCNTRDVLGGDA